MARWLAGTSLAAALLLLMALAGPARASGPGGWENLGGTPSAPPLNAAVYALNADRAGALYVGGPFTAAGGVAGADRLAKWNGASWSAVTPAPAALSNGAVNAIAYDAATDAVIVGGTFTNAGGNANADFLAAWNGAAWTQVCASAGAPITATVYALQIIGRTLYVAGAFADGAGIASADRLVACNLDTGAASSTIVNAAHEFTGTVYALTADSNGTLYAGGGFTDLEGIAAADDVAYRDSDGWHAMGSGGGSCSCAVDDFVRSLTANGTDVYVGTDSVNVAGIAQADHVVRWDGATWSALGSNNGGADGFFPVSAFVYGLAHNGSTVYATGSFQNAGGDPRADQIAAFDGTAWHPVGSDGAGNGPLDGSGLAVARFGTRVIAGGNFTSAGGDTLARFLAARPDTYRLTVSRGGTGTGSISVNGTECPSFCTYDLAPETPVDVSALPDMESRFSGWLGACGGTGACHVTMIGNKIVEAVFAGTPACSSIGGYTATAGIAKLLHLECHDTEGNPITYGVVSGPSHGTLGPVAADGGVTYTPDRGYSGPDEFTYNGTSPDGIAPTAFVFITVSDPGFAVAAAHVALALGRLRPSATGRLALRMRNANAFAVRAVSLKVTSARPHHKVVTFLASTKKVTLGARRRVTLKGRLKRSGLAALKRLGHVPVRVRVVLQAPDGSRSTVTKRGTLRAPKSR